LLWEIVMRIGLGGTRVYRFLEPMVNRGHE
jgi:hypothetical protein